MRIDRTKRLLVALAAGLFLHASVSTARADSSDLVWIVPVAVLGAAAIVVVAAGVIRESKKDEPRGGRPRRGGLQPGFESAGRLENQSGVAWGLRRCSTPAGPALVCW